MPGAEQDHMLNRMDRPLSTDERQAMRFLSLLGIMLLLTSLHSVGQTISAPRRDDKGKSEPPGAVVEARLTAKQNTYTLDLNGKTAEEYQKQLKDGAATGNYPPPPKIDVVLELTNTSDKEVQLQFGGTRNVLTLDLQGPGAETVVFKGRATPQLHAGFQNHHARARQEPVNSGDQPGLWHAEHDPCRLLDGSGKLHS